MKSLIRMIDEAAKLADAVNVPASEMRPVLYRMVKRNAFRVYTSGYETGDGRFKVTKTDNANARAIGRNPKWTVTDTKTGKWTRVETLAEVREWCWNEERKVS